MTSDFIVGVIVGVISIVAAMLTLGALLAWRFGDDSLEDRYGK